LLGRIIGGAGTVAAIFDFASAGSTVLVQGRLVLVSDLELGNNYDDATLFLFLYECFYLTKRK
jgi:hypothetical protein